MTSSTTWPIAAQHSVIPACDIPLDRFEVLVRETADLPMVSAYKVGFVLALSAGLPRVVEVARRYTDKPLIYDHQKAATDIPATGGVFMQTLQRAGIDAVILFPQAGPHTERAWIDAGRAHDLHVIVGGWMTHPGYRQSDGGFLSNEGILKMYRVAAQQQITDYVVPGNQPDAIAQIRALLVEEGIAPTFYSPGLLTQGGSLEDAASAAQGAWHAIIGRRITQSSEPRQSILDLWPASW